MAKTPFHDTYNAALIERSKSPLPSGEYKLKEAYATLRKRYAALDVIDDGHANRSDAPNATARKRFSLSRGVRALLLCPKLGQTLW